MNTSTTKRDACVFFDFDGTLHDSMRVYGPALRSVYGALVASGRCPERDVSDEAASKWLGLSVEDMWTTFAPELTTAEWREAANAVRLDMDVRIARGEAALYPGVPEMLDTLVAAGYDIAILSNCQHSYAESHMKHFHLEKWASAFYAAEDYGFIPKWEIYAQVAAKHPGFESKHQLMVGDRKSDIDVALHAYIPSIGCTYGFGGAHELDDATTYATAPAEIPSLVQSLIG